MRQSNWIILIIFVFVLTSLACNFGFNRSTGSEIDAQQTPEPPAALDSAPSDAEPATDFAGIEPIIVTESQLGALMEQELQQRIGDQISNLQVNLQSGQILILGDVNTQGISAPVRVVIDVNVDPVGRPILNIISANIGPFPVPDDMVAEVEVLINKVFQEKVISLAPNMHVDNIVIQNGVMTITGHSK